MDPARVWDGTDFDVAVRVAANNHLAVLNAEGPADA